MRSSEPLATNAGSRRRFAALAGSPAERRNAKPSSTPTPGGRNKHASTLKGSGSHPSAEDRPPGPSDHRLGPALRESEKRTSAPQRGQSSIESLGVFTVGASEPEPQSYGSAWSRGQPVAKRRGGRPLTCTPHPSKRMGPDQLLWLGPCLVHGWGRVLLVGCARLRRLAVSTACALFTVRACCGSGWSLRYARIQ